MDSFSLLGLLLLPPMLLFALLYYMFLLPPKYPQGIPAVPFWVTLIPFFRDVDQSDTFKKYISGPIRAHGVVKIFFAARWNILVHHPRYLGQLFKHEDIYQKSGNHEKIPYSVLATFLGENIISSHGSTWKQYRDVIKPGLQRTFEAEILAHNAERLCDLLDNASFSSETESGGVAIQELLQRYTIANVAQTILQTDFGTLDRTDTTIHVLQSAMKQEIFKPVFMSFPFLDWLPIPRRKAARKMIDLFKDELTSGLVGSHQDVDLNSLSNKLGARLLAARDSGKLSEKQFRDNLTVLYVAGQENPQIGLISMLYLLAQNPNVQEKLLREIQETGAIEPTYDALQAMPFLAAVVYECLRMLPPISQLINRRTAADIWLDSHVYIPEGMYLGYHCYSTHHDVAVWGPDADCFYPERWGLSMADIQKFYRHRRTRAEFITFHGGNRACLGEKFAILELKITLFVLVRRFSWELDPTWPNRMTPAGPLFPRALRLIFRRREKVEHGRSPDACYTDVVLEKELL